MNNTNQTPEENYSDWVNSKIVDDEFVQTYSEDILSKPKFVLSTTASEFDKEPLYSAQQMIEMFRLGFLSVCKTDFGKKALTKKRQRVAVNPYSVIRQMSVGDKTTFPYTVWNSVRVAASKIHSQFGATFRVNKLAPNCQVGDIEVTRLS